MRTPLGTDEVEEEGEARLSSPQRLGAVLVGEESGAEDTLVPYMNSREKNYSCIWDVIFCSPSSTV